MQWRRYRDDFSLARLVERLRDRSEYDSDVLPYLYDQLLRLFHLINGDSCRFHRLSRLLRVLALVILLSRLLIFVRL